MSSKAGARLPIVLSIAGFDPSSGAGITADIKTIAAHRCYGVTCITALTVQSTQGVRRFEPVGARIFTESLEELAADFTIAAVRIGMIGSAEIARATAAFLRRHQLKNIVLDPIINASSGLELISHEGPEMLKEKLLPLADVITPNIDEAAALTGLPVSNLDQMHAAAEELQRLGARNVIITGGHLDPPIDLLRVAGDPDAKLFEGKKISVRSTHGTGCAFATSVACNLARCHTLMESAREAKQYVANALLKAIPLGKGRGPLNHLAAPSARIRRALISS